MGYDRKDVEHSLRTRAYDDPFATYLLLGTKDSDVSNIALFEILKCRIVELSLIKTLT